MLTFLRRLIPIRNDWEIQHRRYGPFLYCTKNVRSEDIFDLIEGSFVLILNDMHLNLVWMWIE